MSFQTLLVVLMICSVSSLASAEPYILPWTSPQVKNKVVSCWGRKYDFSKGLLPSKIVTQGKDILAGPIGLEAAIGGKRVKWAAEGFEVRSKNAESLHYVTRASAVDLAVECILATEFDGTTRVDLKLAPTKEITVDSLNLIVPLKSEYARLFHHSSVYPVHVWDWPKKQMNSGAVKPEGLKLPFVFHLWLGDDARGIQFFSESDEVWSPADPKSAITITPGSKAAVLRMDLLHDTKLSTEWKWTFGFTATPVKPYPKDYRKNHYCHLGTYGHEHNQYTGEPADKDHPAYLDVMAKMGIKWLGFHESWSDEQSLPRPKRVDELKSLLAACKQKGIGLVPYTGCYMSTRSPEYSKDWDSLPIGDHYQYQRPDNGDICRIMCNNTGYPDVLVKLYTQAFKDYGLGGIYMDGFTYPLPCVNRKHGCGYVGKDGEVHPTMAIWKTREAMKSLYRMVKSQPKPGIIVAHTSSCILLPVLGFSDFYLDGEHLTSMLKIGTPDYSDGILRAEMTGHNFGIPATQLPCGDGEEGRARARTISTLYDALWMWHADHQADIWKAWDSFGVSGAEWVGPWRSDRLAVSSNKDFKVSAYLDRGRGALFVVANLGPNSSSTMLKVDRKALGLPAGVELEARDEVSGGLDIPVADDQVQVTVEAGKFKMISVQERR